MIRSDRIYELPQKSDHCHQKSAHRAVSRAKPRMGEAATRSVVGGRVKERRGPSGKWFQIAPENRVLGTCQVFEGPRFLVRLLNHQPRGPVDAHELHPTRVRFCERADHEIAISLEFSWRIVRGERDVGRQSRTMIRVAPAFHHTEHPMSPGYPQRHRRTAILGAQAPVDSEAFAHERGLSRQAVLAWLPCVRTGG